MAFNFSGSTDTLTATSVAAQKITGNMTICATAKTNAVNTGNFIIVACGASGETEAANFLYTLRRSTTTWTYFHENGAGVNNQIDLPSPGLTSGVWYRVCVIRDTVANNVRWIINGTDHGTVSTGYTADPTGGTSTNILIGSNGDGGAFWTGPISDVALFDRALTPAQGLAYTQGASPLLLGTPISYWQLRDSAKDLMGTLNLTASGSPSQVEGLPVSATSAQIIQMTPAAGGGATIPIFHRHYANMRTA